MEKTKIGRRFEGKVAIVTASTQGIGFAIAQRLGSEGASVVIAQAGITVVFQVSIVTFFSADFDTWIPEILLDLRFSFLFGWLESVGNEETGIESESLVL